MTHSPSSSSSSSHHLERLADLYLTGSPSHGDSSLEARESSRRTFVEALVVGHLPVRAGLWLTQYADEVARDEGPTGLVRLDGDQLILEILRGTESVTHASAAATLEEAIAFASPFVRRWIVRPALGATPREVVQSSPDVITLLSGADEVAVVAAYGAVKDLVDGALSHDLPLPRIELAVLGAERAQAEHSRDMISRTTLAHLGVDLALRRHVRAMGALGSTLHFRFPADHSPTLVDVMRILRESSDREDHAAEPAMTDPMAPAPLSWRVPSRPAGLPLPPARASSTAPFASPLAETGFPLPASPRPSMTLAATTVSPAAPAGPEGPVRVRPKPSSVPAATSHVEPKRLVPLKPVRPLPNPRSLSSWIPGLALLPVRCPDAREVEIAADAGGHVHLVAWEDRQRQLSLVAGWVAKHAELIALACPDHALSLEVAAACHLFTSEPVQVADLHGTGVRLHVLAPVEVEGSTGWYAAALNA